MQVVSLRGDPWSTSRILGKWPRKGKEAYARLNEQDITVRLGAFSHWECLGYNTEYTSELFHQGFRRLGYLSINFLLFLCLVFSSHWQAREWGVPRTPTVPALLYILKHNYKPHQRNGVDTKYFYNFNPKGYVNGILWRSMQDSNNIVSMSTYRNGTLKTSWKKRKWFCPTAPHSFFQIQICLWSQLDFPRIKMLRGLMEAGTKDTLERCSIKNNWCQENRKPADFLCKLQLIGN